MFTYMSVLGNKAETHMYIQSGCAHDRNGWIGLNTVIVTSFYIVILKNIRAARDWFQESSSVNNNIYS